MTITITNIRRPRQSTTRLAKEILDAIESDPLYGPKHDRARHMIGIEFEVILEETLKIMGKNNETP
jgi:uncharacterized protein (UPF0297 family)